MNQELAKELFKYKNGKLIWLKKPSKTSPAKIGGQVGTLMKDGYLRTQIQGKFYAIHRLIYLLHYGEMPKFIDHIDCNRTNNKIENLRIVSLQQNGYNRKINKNNKSGVKGVSWSKSAKKWVAQLKINGCQTYLGCYENLNDAKEVVEEVRSKEHGIYARHC